MRNVTYGISQKRWEILKEWRRDCRDYVVADDQPITVANPVQLCGERFSPGEYHKDMPR